MAAHGAVKRKAKAGAVATAVAACALATADLAAADEGAGRDGLVAVAGAGQSDEAAAPLSLWAQSSRTGRGTARRRPAGRRSEMGMAAMSLRESPSFGTRFGVGMEGGYEARYGNGVAVHALWAPWLDTHVGFGWNLSGFKVGAGADVVKRVSDSVGIMGGGALVFSTGRSGEVSLDANFQEEGGGQSKVTATKKYTVSGAQYLNVAGGAFYAVSSSLRLSAMLGYNMVVGGNRVTFDDQDIQYDRDVDVTNGKEADQEFRKKAEDKAKTGGVGVSLGLLYML